MTDSQLPLYVNRGGEIVGATPYLCRDVRTYNWVLRGQTDRLDQMLDRYLNQPSGGAVDFRSVTPHVLINVVQIGRIGDLIPPQSLLGTSNENEVGFWTLAEDTRRGTFSVFIPYMYVDSGAVMAGGREIFGFPKQHCQLIATPPRSFQVVVRAMDQFAPSTEAIHKPLFEVQALQPLNEHDLQVEWSTLGQATRALTQAVFSTSAMWPTAPPTVWPSRTPVTAPIPAPRTRPIVRLRPEAVARPPDRPPLAPLGALSNNINRALLAGDVPMVFLKQFRDVTVPAHACYQAIIEGSSSIVAFRGGGMLPSTYAVTLADWDNQPIRWELGLAEGTITPEISFWLDFDFTVETGRELWRAGGHLPPVSLAPQRG